MGKANGPMVFSKHHDLSGLGPNGREIEALDLNHASLEVAWFNRLLGTGCQLTVSIIVGSYWSIIVPLIKNYFFVLIFRKIQIYIRLYGFDVFLWQALWDIPEAALNHSEPFLRHFTDICEEWLWTALNRLVLFLIAQRRYQNRWNLETALNRSKPLWTNWWKWQAIARNITKPFRAAWSYFLIEFNKKLWTA